MRSSLLHCLYATILLLGSTRYIGQDASAAPVGHELPGYLSHPSCTVTADATTWTAWHSYHDQQDTIVVSRLSPKGHQNKNRETTWSISDPNTTSGPPKVVHRNGSTWVVWQAASPEGKWHIITRRFRGDAWGATHILSDPSADSIYPAVTDDAHGNVYVSWTQLSPQGGSRITVRAHDGASWQPPQNASSENAAAYRSDLTVDGAGNLRVFWDEYAAGKNYRVMARTLSDNGRAGTLQQVSPVGEYCLKPTSLRIGDEVYVAWLNKRDVIGGPGAVSQWHTLQVAVETTDGWSLISDSEGNSTAAELTQGLMAKISPKAVATGGYLGRRTAPILAESRGEPWILWERKSDHMGSTPRVVGDLVGRPLRDQRLGTTVVLHHGRVDYHVAHDDRSGNDSIALIASQLPRSTKRLYHTLDLDFSETTPFKQEAWDGWRETKLPIGSEVPARQQVQVDGKSYQLFWVDMHCHSGLTADAEGEPDELMHYAKDRAALDMVVFTNNDFLYDVPLTGYEYAFSNFFARTATHRDFLALPGYEWTSRIPGVRTASLDDSGNWTPPYQNRSYPNHRSVVFPPTGGPLVRFPEVGNDIRRLNEAVEKAGGITLTQHDAFQPSGHAVEVAMELTSGWRNYVTRVPNLFHDPLNAGAKMGFVACGDTHRRAPGLSGALTAVYAEELTADSIFDALKNRRCYATNGSRIFLDARIDGAFIGQEVTNKTGKAVLRLTAIGTRPITSATLIRNGKVVKKFTAPGDSKQFDVTFTDEELAKGTHWYYWRVLQDGVAPFLPGNVMAAHGHMAWSSPIWVTVP